MLLTGKRLGALLKTGSSTPLAESLVVVPPLVLVLVPSLVLVLVLVLVLDPISREPGAGAGATTCVKRAMPCFPNMC